jgi:hypothetical protein
LAVSPEDEPPLSLLDKVGLSPEAEDQVLEGDRFFLIVNVSG